MALAIMISLDLDYYEVATWLMELAIMNLLDLVVVAVGVAGILWARLRGSSDSNSKAIIQWMEAMDVTIGGHRYRGERIAVVRTLREGRVGLVGFAVALACVTRSGRCFELQVRSQLARVVEWSIIPRDTAILDEWVEDARVDSEPAQDRGRDEPQVETLVRTEPAPLVAAVSVRSEQARHVD
jgi:hypothetical protein